MILNGPGKISIMVGGQVVGMAKEAKFSIAEDDASTKEFSDPWRTPDIKQSWDISCDAMVRDACYRRDARTVATADMLTAEKIKWSLSASVGRKLAFPFGPPS